jgi:N-acetylneuraminic acid mutarotase
MQAVFHAYRAQTSQSSRDFDEVLPIEASVAKVTDTLRRVNALEKKFNIRITGEMLQAELTRMSQATRRPEILREIFAALNYDPRLVAEALARSNVVEQLTNNNPYFNEQWQLEKENYPAEIVEQAYTYATLDITSNSSFDDDTWRAMPAMPENVRPRMAVWTGVEMIVWGGGPETFSFKVNSGSRYNPATDMWLPVTGFNAPSRRAAHTLVWTGTEMIAWGGCTNVANFCSENSGGRYNPVTDSWSPVSLNNAPSPRHRHTAVWAGDRMIVWGGCRQTTTSVCRTSPIPDGGMYSPATDTWSGVTTADVGQVRHTAVWTGSEMIVFGGYGEEGNNKLGGRYNPNTNTWTPLNPAGAPFPRLDHTAIWTGTEMIIWGGVDGSLVPQNTGARYNPSTNTWAPTSTTNAPGPRRGHTAVWTGAEMIIWGGENSSVPGMNDGGRYNPATDAWTPTSSAGAPPPRADHVAVWTGTEMIVWGASGKTGGRYNPATNTWLPTGMNDAPDNRTQSKAVWTGAEMIVFGGDWGNIGSRYNPATAIWTPIRPLNEIPVRNDGFSLVWTGSEMIVWGGGITALWADGARYNPATDMWAIMSQAGAPSARTRHTAVWTGSEMIVWGGQTNEGLTNTGARYNPSTDAWAPIPNSNAPEPRYMHTAVVVGNQMVVWGGLGEASTFLNTGGRYNFSSNTWQPISTAGAPSPRYFHTAISTGTEMIIWGGRFTNVDTPSALNTGGRYNAVSDTWTPTSTVNAPSPRSRHTAVWTGSEMIVYAGNTENFTQFLNTGGRYNPATNSWRPTSMFRVGTQRAAHVAVWTGKSMLIWGGVVNDGDARAGYEYFARNVNTTRYDFDGDGRADVGVFRPSERTWHLQRTTSGYSAVPFGAATDKIVPADFDGDGKTDIAVFRDGVWYWLQSSNSSYQAVQFGVAADIPMPADFSGDGRAELAVYRNGVWWTLNLANNQSTAVQFGNASDTPVPADYDGDGKTDPAIYRGGTWWMLRSTEGVGVAQFGIATDRPVVADFDGDRRADRAVYRDGVWYVSATTQGFYAIQYGVASDVPVPADYDGDGRADLAVFRSGVWYRYLSQQGSSVVQFGRAGDLALSAAGGQ